MSATHSPTARVSTNRLATWKTSDLLFFKRTYEKQISEMDRVRQSLGLSIQEMQMNIDYPDLKNIFIARFNRDMLKAIKFVEVIKAELKRRSTMVGAA